MTIESPYAAPKSSLLENSDSLSNIHGFKKLVVQGENQIWPSRCYKCNVSTENAKQVKLYYINPWIYITFIISPLVYIIVSLIVRKKYVLNLPICDNHLKRRKRFIMSQWIVATITVTLLTIGISLNNSTLIITSILLFIYFLAALVLGRMAYIVKLKDERIWIKGAGKDFISSLPELPQ